MSDKDEKATAVLTNQEKLDALKDTSEYRDLLNNYGETYLKAKEGEFGKKYTGQALNMIDKNFMAALGIEEKDKPSGKTGDWINSVGLENVRLKAELEKLNGSNSDDGKSTANEDLKNLHSIELEAVRKEMNEANETNKALSLSISENKTSNELALGLQGVTFDPKYSEKHLKQLLSFTTSQLLADRKIVDGIDVFYKEDGTMYAANGLPMSAKEVAKEAYRDLVQVKTKGGGGDTNTNSTNIKGDILAMENVTQYKSFEEWNFAFKRGVAAKGWAVNEERTIKLKKATYEHYKIGALKVS